MNTYENGFYIYTPSAEAEEGMHELSLHQVIQIIEDEIWLTGISGGFDVDYANSIGVIGRMVMGEDGSIPEELEQEAAEKLCLESRANVQKLNEGKE